MIDKQNEFLEIHNNIFRLEWFYILDLLAGRFLNLCRHLQYLPAEEGGGDQGLRAVKFYFIATPHHHATHLNKLIIN